MTTLTEITARQQEKEVVINENFEAVAPAGLFGVDWENTEDLTLGIFGGRLWDGSADTLLADVTLTLTASQTNYVEATTAGVVSANTSAFTAGRIKLFTVTTTASGVDVVTDYRQFVMQRGKQVLGAMTSAELAAAVSDETGSGALVFATSPTFAGNMSFSATGLRLLADFSTLSPVASRAGLQSSTVNGGTFVHIVPNGTNQNATFVTLNDSSLTNSPFGLWGITASAVRVSSGALGAGSVLPLDLQISGNPYVRLFTSGRVAVGSTSPSDDGTHALQVTGAISASTWSKVGSYTVATLPSAATAGAGAMAWCTDASAGAVLVTSNGSAWKIAGTQTTVS